MITRRSELAEFLRSRRARLMPADVGLPDGGLRRTPGLRREEVAVLAGVGVTWYTWLEQGREINPSDEVLASIARTLRLSRAETEHVFRLARAAPATNGSAGAPAVLRRLVDHLEPAGAILLDARWDVLAWNRTAEDYFQYSQVPAADRNAVLMMFGWPRIREVLQDWERHAPRIIGAFRASSADQLDDPRFVEVLDRLRAEHPEVNRWWDDHEVAPKTGVRKALRHPVTGRIEVDEVVLRPAVAPGLQLVLNLPVGLP